jgi:hypothetical protein
LNFVASESPSNPATKESDIPTGISISHSYDAALLGEVRRPMLPTTTRKQSLAAWIVDETTHSVG